MSTYHINDSGTITAPYDTWAKAAQFLSTPSKANNDQFLIDSTHQETYTASTTITFVADSYYFNSVISGVPDSPSGLASASPGAKLITTLERSLTFRGSVYCEGLVFEIGGGGYYSNFNINDDGAKICHQIYKDCTFRFFDDSTFSGIIIGGSSTYGHFPNKCEFINVKLKLTNLWQNVTVYYGDVLFEGLSYEAGTTAGTNFLKRIGSTTNNSPCRVVFSGCDFSLMSASAQAVGSAYGMGEVIFKNCLLPVGWGGSLYSGTVYKAMRISMYNCDSGATNYKMLITAGYGTIKAETTIVRTNGAYDGATQLSWKAYAVGTKYPVETLDLDPIVAWNSVTGSSVTATIEIVTDTATALTEADIWMDVEYLGNASNPISTVVSTKPSSMITTASDLPSSSATWTTTGLSTPLKQKISLSFTPQMVGFVSVRVKLAKTTATVYVCPKLDLT